MKSRAKVNEFADYVVELTGWEWGYTFGLNPSTRDADPFMEFRHVQLIGGLLSPKGAKCTHASITLIPGTDDDEPNRQAKAPPEAVGGIDARDGTLHGSLSVPRDALDAILTVLAADRFRVLVMDGKKLRYRHAQIRSWRLDTKLDPDELLLD